MEFIGAYPPEKADYAQAWLESSSHVVGVPGAHALLMGDLAAHQACSRWTKQPQYVPLASNFISKEQYKSPPPPHFEIAPCRVEPGAVEYLKYETVAERRKRKGIPHECT